MNPSIQENVDNLLADMRQHVVNLQDKVEVANKAVHRGQTVNEKISIMKEYQEEVGSMNSCFRSKNRNSLVASLQHENRQILALQEENRQLKHALEDMERAMHLIMDKHRSLVLDFAKTDRMLELCRTLDQIPAQPCVSDQNFQEFARIVENVVDVAEQQLNDDAEVIARLRTENRTLLELLMASYKLRVKEDAP
ncbi:fgfr1op2-prov protein [Aphelenchoides avenae]|nr:fgfr1op2-prov protein [Aphelenchus avenae]